MENLAKAIIAVMSEVKGIEKNMKVGEGRNSYDGVSDKEVKQIIGDAMRKNGLTILPIGVEPKTEITRWEEETFYNGKSAMKQKQSVFTEVKTKYLLLHTSGESQVIEGYGQGVDSQDKGAGKATTYALKYTLLYLFLVPTGKIDDADNTHSDSIPTAKKVSEPTADEKAAAMLKKPAIEMVGADEPLKEIIQVNIGSAKDQASLVKVWNAFPEWHKNKAFIDALNVRKKELVKPKTATKTKEVTQ